MSDGDSFEARLDIERSGSNQHLNPMFGEWSHHFRFAPVPYGAGSERRRAMREQIQAEIPNQWLFSHSIHLEIILYLDVQTVLETSDLADLDNYAKAILDGLKGANGIMFDDTQIQALTISWLDTYDEPSFEVRAKGGTDDFILKPVEFHEMPDGLWYPHSRRIWDNGHAIDADDKNHFADLSITETMSVNKQRMRVEARKARMSRKKAYQMGNYVSQLKRGYHKSRLIDSGFQMHELRTWKQVLRAWETTGEGSVLKAIMTGVRGSYDALVKLLSGKS